MDGPFLLIVATMLMLSREVQPCTHAHSTLCSMRYWLAPLVTGPFLACSACYWPVTGLFLACSACYWPVPCLFRLLLACSACSVFSNIDYLQLGLGYDGKFEAVGFRDDLEG